MAGPGSKVVSIEIETSDDYDRAHDTDGVIVTAYGDEGVGKTYSLRNLPAASTLVLGFDPGVKVLKKMRLGHRVIKIRKDLENLDAVIEMIEEDDENTPLGKQKKEMFPDGIKFVVIDHVTEMQKFIEIAFADRRNHFIRTLKDAGDTNAALTRYLRMFRDFSDRGINVIFLALELAYEVGGSKGSGEEQRVTMKLMPMISGKSNPVLSKTLVGISDIVGRLTEDKANKTRGYRLYGGVEETISCKSRYREGASDFPHDEWEPSDLFHIICKAHSIDPEKASAKVQKDNEAERERLRGIKGQRVTAKVDMSKTSATNSVSGSTNESKKKSGQDEASA